MIDKKLSLDLAGWIEEQVQVYGSAKSYLALTGEPFITLTSGGIKKEGECIQVYGRTPKKAIELFKSEFSKYRWKNGGLKLHWRIKPYIKKHIFISSDPSWSDEKYTFYTVRARLLLTNKDIVDNA